MSIPLSATHLRHLTALRGLPAIVDDEGLRIGHQYVMFFAEADLMRQHAVGLIDGFTRPDVLEVGLGLAIFAEQLQDLDVGTYTAVEPHPGVARLAYWRVLDSFKAPAFLHTDAWQSLTLPHAAYDAIMYDTWPPDRYADSDFAAFVDHVAVPCLRPGGRFSFFHSSSALSQSRRDVLDRHFTHWATSAYTMPAASVPPHWTKASCDFLVPIATKGDA